MQETLFKQNVGLLLEQQIYFDEVIVMEAKILTSKELEKPSNNLSFYQLLGKESQGKIYKGKIIAVK